MLRRGFFRAWGQIQLESFLGHISAFASLQDTLWSGTNTARRKSKLQDEQIFLFSHTVSTAQASVTELNSSCDALCSEVAAHTLEIAALQARLLIVASDPPRLGRDAAIRERDCFASIFVPLQTTTFVVEIILPIYFIECLQVFLLCSFAFNLCIQVCLNISGSNLTLGMTKMKPFWLLLRTRFVVYQASLFVNHLFFLEDFFYFRAPSCVREGLPFHASRAFLVGSLYSKSFVSSFFLFTQTQ